MLIRSVLVQGCTLNTSGGVKLSVPAEGTDKQTDGQMDGSLESKGKGNQWLNRVLLGNPTDLVCTSLRLPRKCAH